MHCTLHHNDAYHGQMTIPILKFLLTVTPTWHVTIAWIFLSVTASQYQALFLIHRSTSLVNND